MDKVYIISKQKAWITRYSPEYSYLALMRTLKFHESWTSSDIYMCVYNSRKIIKFIK